MNRKYLILVACSITMCFSAIGCINESGGIGQVNELNEVEQPEETVSYIQYLPPNVVSNFSDIRVVFNQYYINDFGSGRGEIVIKGAIENSNFKPYKRPYTTVVSYPITIVWADFYDKDKNYLFSSNEIVLEASVLAT